MASFVVERVDLFPNTTVVKAYPGSTHHVAQTGAPAGASVTEATMTSGKAELTGLTAGTRYTVYASVSGEDRYLDIAAEGSATSAVNSSLQLNKLLAWTFDPVIASGTKIIATAGTVNFAKLFVPEACRVTNIVMEVTTGNGTPTAAQNFAGLFAEGSRKLLSATADQGTAWESTGVKTMALSEPQNIGQGNCYVAFFSNGTTQPTFRVAASSVAVTLNVGVSGTGIRFGTADTGRTTTLPAEIGSSTAGAIPWFVALT